MTRKKRSNKQTAQRRPASNKKITVIPPRRIGKRSLTQLAKQINAGHKAVIACMQQGLQHGINTGHVLLEVKDRLKHGQFLLWLGKHCDVHDRLKHGQFLLWLGKHCDVHERSCQLYMNLARHEDEIRNAVSDIANFSMRGAIALITKADEAEVVEGIANDADNTGIAATTPDTEADRAGASSTAVTVALVSDQIHSSDPRAVLDVHRDERPAREYSHDELMCINLNSALAFLEKDVLDQPPEKYLNKVQAPERLRAAARFLNRIAAAGDTGVKRNKPESACDIDWEHYKDDDDEPDHVTYARAADWQLHEAERLALEFGLLRPGAQPTKTVLQRIDQVIQAWRELRIKLHQIVASLDEAAS